jgi:hypothetical protein
VHPTAQYGEHELEVQPKSNQRFLATHDKEFHSFLKFSGRSSRLLNPQSFLLLLWIIINHIKFIRHTADMVMHSGRRILIELKRIFNNLRNSFITMLQQMLCTMERQVVDIAASYCSDWCGSVHQRTSDDMSGAQKFSVCGSLLVAPTRATQWLVSTRRLLPRSSVLSSSLRILSAARAFMAVVVCKSVL